MNTQLNLAYKSSEEIDCNELWDALAEVVRSSKGDTDEAQDIIDTVYVAIANVDKRDDIATCTLNANVLLASKGLTARMQLVKVTRRSVSWMFTAY